MSGVRVNHGTCQLRLAGRLILLQLSSKRTDATKLVVKQWNKWALMSLFHENGVGGSHTSVYLLSPATRH